MSYGWSMARARTPRSFRHAFSILFATVLPMVASAQGTAEVRVVLNGGEVRYLEPIAAARPVELVRAKPQLAESSSAALKAYAGYFGIADPNLQLQQHKSSRDAQSDVIRYRQLHDGLPVIGGELVLALDEWGRLRSLTGEVKPDVAVDDVPTNVSAAEAQRIAAVAVSKYHGVAVPGLVAGDAELSVYDPRLIGPRSAASARKVWRVEITSVAALPIREMVLIDVSDGAIALSFNQAESARNRLTYTASFGGSVPGALVCSELEPLCTNGTNIDADLAHRYAGETYDFYQSRHGRDSYNNAGASLISTVQYSPPGYCPNAGWTGSQMLYCPGAPAADDVVAHELTHAVTQYTSGLYYYYQSGAINESFSDVWGEFLDLTNTSGTDTVAVRWKMGEDFGSAIRDMRDPTLFGHADRMTSPFYWTSPADNGGVHRNSGVNNKAASLMVDGGTFNSYTVTGIGIDKVAALYYRVQTQHLTSGSDYADLYLALNRACQNMIGTSGITADDCVQVTNAVNAVEMGSPPVLDQGTEAPVCAAGFDNADVFHDSFEAALTAWGVSALVGTSSWAITSGFAAHGVRSAWAFGPSNLSDYTLAMVNAVPIPPNAFLHFRHSFDQEWSGAIPLYYDGGLVEYSTDGTTWLDAAPLFSAGKNYGGVLQADNPRAGRNAFVGASHGYVSTRYNLASLAGSNVRFRFRNTSDTGTASGARSWIIDDVRIYVCVNSAIPNAVPVANAGADQTVAPLRFVTLDSSASTDSDGVIVSTEWTQVSGPQAIVTRTGRQLTFTSPPTATQETLVFRATVTDNRGATASDEVSVTVLNRQPVANAGADMSTKPRTLISLNGGATDSDGSIASYTWSQASGSAVTLGSANTSSASFFSPSVATTATYVFKLTARDNYGGSGSDEVAVVVSNAAPAANAGPDATVEFGASVALAGSGTDPDGNIISYRWSQIDGPPVSILNPTNSTASFGAPSQGTYTLRLTVTDNDQATASDEMTVTVTPLRPANSGGGGGSLAMQMLLALSLLALLRRIKDRVPHLSVRPEP